MARIERLYIQPKTTPRLFDRPIQDIQRALADRVTYLEHVFGRAERLVTEVEGRRYYSPNVYRGDREYISLLPDNDRLGNYCFFTVDEPEQIVADMGMGDRLRAPFSLIVWVDMREVSQRDERNTYQVELDILNVLTSKGITKTGGITVSRVYHKAENVFDGFTIDEIDNQFLMSPYFGMRITGEIYVDTDCLNVV